MEVTPTDLQKHVTHVNAILQQACEARDPAPLVGLNNGIITLVKSCPSALSREVTSDLSNREIAIRLPIPDGLNPRFWVAIQEEWRWKTRHKLIFVQCGLRLYIGDRGEEAIQSVRLEWVAPTYDDNGILAYQGTHAGHPHWHIDRSALVGHEDYIRSLEILTSTRTEPEEFTSEMTTTFSRPLYDFSWLQAIHFPAQAQWMQSEWDGSQVPGPHQCEPNTLDELSNWWAGALRYLFAELPR